MLEALWSMNFTSNLGLIGCGVVVIETGRILGGDSLMIYIGDYEFKNDIMSARIHVKKYADIPSNADISPNIGSVSVMGLDDFNLNVKGSLSTDSETLTLEGHVVGNPSLKITINATRRANLP